MTADAASCLTLEAMKLFPHILTVVCFAAALVANADEKLSEKSNRVVDSPTNAQLQLLQGKWEGATVGQELTETVTITVTGNSFHFHRDTNFWFETTITLPADTKPQQLHATIKGSAASQRDAIGKVVVALFKIEDGTLTLATNGHGAEKLPKSFEVTENEGLTLYELRRVQPQEKIPQPPKTK